MISSPLVDEAVVVGEEHEAVRIQVPAGDAVTHREPRELRG